MAKVEQLRKLNQRRPEVADRIMREWGSRELAVYIGDLLRSASIQRPKNPEDDIADALQALKEQHDCEFPQHVVAQDEMISDEIILNDNFRLINANFPHIGRRLATSWGKPGFSEYINDLLNNTRDGTRRGFPKEIVAALWKLMQDHDRDHPDLELKLSDIWSINHPD